MESRVFANCLRILIEIANIPQLLKNALNLLNHFVNYEGHHLPDMRLKTAKQNLLSTLKGDKLKVPDL